MTSLFNAMQKWHGVGVGCKQPGAGETGRGQKAGVEDNLKGAKAKMSMHGKRDNTYRARGKGCVEGEERV